MKTAQLTAVWWINIGCLAALADVSPRIEFDRTVYDFGKTSQVESITGTFKFKNVGDGVLKVAPPKPSCGCTIAGLKPDTLNPGETGALEFTLNFGHYRAQMEKHIVVNSNDPKNPTLSLTIKGEYTPLYDLSPMAITPNLPWMVNQTNQSTTITRTDGKPLRIFRLDGSKPWITGEVQSDPKGDSSVARILVQVRRDGQPRRFNEYLNIYAGDRTNSPVSTIYLYGQVLGEVSVNPEALYWSVTDLKQPPAERPESLVTRRVTIRGAKGQVLELKNPKSTVQEIQVELLAKENSGEYELVAKLKDTPRQTISGSVSFETSVAAQPRIEVPVIVNVFKP